LAIYAGFETIVSGGFAEDSAERAEEPHLANGEIILVTGTNFQIARAALPIAIQICGLHHNHIART
jgi:hypothetical protein